MPPSHHDNAQTPHDYETLNPADAFIPLTVESLQNSLRRSHLSPREQVSILENIIDINEPKRTQERLDRLNEILLTAAQTFVVPAQRYSAANQINTETPNDSPLKIKTHAENQSALQTFESAMMDFYALVLPTTQPDSNPWICEVEARTRLHNTSRKGKLWNSQPQDRCYLSAVELSSQLQSTNPQIKKRAEFLQRDINGWAGPFGLPAHTAGVAWAVEHYAHNIQAIVTENKHNQSSSLDIKSQEARDMACELDPDLMRAWLLSHDAGRLFTHDSFDHAAFSQFIFAHFGLPHKLTKDFDLPTILLFDSVAPAVLPPQLLDIPSELLRQKRDKLSAKDQNHLSDIEEKNRLARIKFVDDILTQLPEQSEHGFFTSDENFNPLSVVLFWYLDAYTKLLDLREVPGNYFEDALTNSHAEAPTDRYNAYGDRIGKDRTGLPISVNLHNRQPGDEQHFLTSRITHYIPELSHAPIITAEAIDSAGLDPSDAEKAHYYLRQLELANSIYEWLQVRLGLSPQQIWILFFNVTDVTRHMLNGKRLFQYEYFSAEIPWVEDPLLRKTQLK